MQYVVYITVADGDNSSNQRMYQPQLSTKISIRHAATRGPSATTEVLIIGIKWRRIFTRKSDTQYSRRRLEMQNCRCL